MPCSPQELLTESAKFADLPPGMRAIIKTALLCRIENILNPEPEPTDDMQVYHAAFADPNGNVTPTDGQIANLYYQDGAVVNLWKWSVADQNWTQLIVPKKIYRALLTQDGSNAPVATVLENTIGNIVWSRAVAGSYRATLVNAFPDGKTFLIMGNQNNSDNGAYNSLRSSADEYQIVTWTLPDGQSDGMLKETAVEILVYP